MFYVLGGSTRTLYYGGSHLTAYFVEALKAENGH
jgi:hypothetical protein